MKDRGCVLKKRKEESKNNVQLGGLFLPLWSPNMAQEVNGSDDKVLVVFGTCLARWWQRMKTKTRKRAK